MKLKPIVASMVLLGVSGPVFAAYATGPATSHHDTSSQLAAMNAKIARMEQILNRNSAGHFQQPHTWMNRIALSGELNIDAVWSDRTPKTTSTGSDMYGRYNSSHYTDIGLSDANVYMDVQVNDWANGHLAFIYSDALDRGYSHFNTPQFDNSGSIEVDEAYVTFGNFNVSPWYFRVGQEYVPFGVYDRHPVQVSLTQAIAMTRETAAEVGFIDASGFHAAAYVFNGQSKDNVENGGVTIGYDTDFNHDSGMSATLGYIDDIRDGLFLNQTISNLGGTPTESAHAIALDVAGHMGQFDGAFHWVTTEDDFSFNDQIHAIGVNAGYSFPVMGNNSHVEFGYQWTEDAQLVTPVSTSTQGNGFGLPEHRFYGQYEYHMMKNTALTMRVYHDEDYSSSDGGSGKDITAGVLRLGVKLA